MTRHVAVAEALEEFSGCAEWDRLLRRFIAATGDIIAIQAQAPGAPAIDSEHAAFDTKLRRAVTEKLRAKWELLRHLKGHPCCGLPEWTAVGSAAMSQRG